MSRQRDESLQPPLRVSGGDAYGLMQVAPSLVSLFAPNDQRGNHGTFMISPYTDAMGRTVTGAMPNGAAFDKYLDETNTQNMTARGLAQQANDWISISHAGGRSMPRSARRRLRWLR